MDTHETKETNARIIVRRRFGAFSSSTNPEQLAASVSGGILMFSAVIVMVAGYLNIPITDTQLAQAAAQIGAVAGGLWFIFGLVRKGFILLHSRFSNDS